MFGRTCSSMLTATTANTFDVFLNIKTEILVLTEMLSIDTSTTMMSCK